MLELLTVVVPPHAEPASYQEVPGASVDSYWWETSVVCVPLIFSEPRPFLTFLRNIEAKGKPVFFPTVLNPRFDKLLRLRGYIDAVTKDKHFGLVEGLLLFGQS